MNNGLSRNWWLVVLRGVLAVLFGLTAFVWPDITWVVLVLMFGIYMVLLIAGWAVFTGILEIVAAIRLRHEINNEWLLALGGVVSIALGVLLILQPVAGGIAIIWTVAAYAVIFGFLLIALGFRLKNRNISGDRQTLRSA